MHEQSRQSIPVQRSASRHVMLLIVSFHELMSNIRKPLSLAYIDPQSYNNLSKYDLALLGSVDRSVLAGEIRYFCSSSLDLSPPDDVKVLRIYHYNKRRTSVGKLLSYGYSSLIVLFKLVLRPASIYHFQWIKFAPLDLIFIKLLRFLTGGKVVLTAHNVVPHGAERRSHRVLGMIYRSVDRILVHNEDSADQIARRFAVPDSRFVAIPHGLITLVPKGSPTHAAKIQQFVERVPRCFLFFGTGSRYKGLDILLSSWCDVSKKCGTAAGLIILGRIEADLREEINNVVAECPDSLLVIDEFVSEADLFFAVNSCDIVVLPHRCISQSGILLSVLDMRVPVLVSNRPGLMEPLAIADIGWSFDGTREGLASMLVALIEDGEELDQKKNNHAGWEEISAHYDWTRIGPVVAQVYRSLHAN